MTAGSIEAIDPNTEESFPSRYLAHAGPLPAIVVFRNDGTHLSRYVREPFRREPDFGVTFVNYDIAELLARREEPR